MSAFNDIAHCEYVYKGFEEYFDRHRVDNLKNRSDYAELKDEEREIFEKYPAIRDLFENDIVEGFSKEEKEAVSREFSIESTRNRIERKEAFKLGFKEAYIFFEEMGMLNI